MRANGQCCAVLHCFHRQVWLELARLHVEGWPGVAGRGDLTQWWTFKRSEVKWRTMFWLWDKPSIMESPMHATGCSYCSYCWCLLCDLRPKFLFWLVIVELVRSNTWNGVNALTLDISEFLELRLLGPSCGLMFGFAFLFSNIFV